MLEIVAVGICYTVLDARGLLSTTSMLSDIKRTSDNVIKFTFEIYSV